MRFLPFVAAMAFLSTSAHAQTLTDLINRAQGEMYQRINAAVDAYAAAVGLDHTFVGYCISKLALEEAQYPTPGDGQIPFGVNYNRITSVDHLNIVIDARETFERTFLILCLAEARMLLNAAEGR